MWCNSWPRNDKERETRAPTAPTGQGLLSATASHQANELDPKTLRPRSVPRDELHRRNCPHLARWLEVYRLREMPDDMFKKETGEKKTWDNTFLAAAKTLHADVETIRKSYKKVQRALREGKGYQFWKDALIGLQSLKTRVRKPSKVLP